MDQKKYKIGYAAEISPAYAAAIEINPVESVTVVNLALTGAATINIGDTAQPVPGKEIIVVAASDGTARDVTFGTGITGPVLAGVINKTKTQRFVYVAASAAWVAVGAPVQID